MTDDRPILRLAHSPDPDDAFMWWPLFSLEGNPPRIDTGRFRYEPVLADVETLNQRAIEGDLEITAMSCAQYPQVRQTYALTSCGASMGDGYGPKLVATREWTVEELRESDIEIAIPGERTTAALALRLLLKSNSVRYKAIPFDTVADAIMEGTFQVGVVIHEGQLTWQDAGLRLIADLGTWWRQETGSPLPLGVNTIRRDLESAHGPGTLGEVTAALLNSVEYALAHREESIAYALNYARGIQRDLADQFVALYVNKWTLAFGEVGERAVRDLLTRGHHAGLCDDPGPIDIIRPVENRVTASSD